MERDYIDLLRRSHDMLGAISFGQASAQNVVNLITDLLNSSDMQLEERMRVTRAIAESFRDEQLTSEGQNEYDSIELYLNELARDAEYARTKTGPYAPKGTSE